MFKTSRDGSGAVAEPNPMFARRTALIIWGALFAGVVIFAVVATVVGPNFWPQGGQIADLLAWVALGMALVMLPVSRVVPSRIKATPGAPPEALAVARTIVATALNEGAGLFAGIAWMLGGRTLALVALAIALSGLLLAFPSTARWQRLSGTTVQAERPNRLVR